MTGKVEAILEEGKGAWKLVYLNITVPRGKVVIVGCFALSYIVTLTYAGGFWVSGLLNTIAPAAFGFSGIVAIVRNESTPFMRAPFLSPKIVGAITAVLGFGLAFAMLGLTLLYATGGSL